jgi:hypothetical protein
MADDHGLRFEGLLARGLKVVEETHVHLTL